MTALEDRQISTGEAMAKIESLMEEKIKAEKARKEAGLIPTHLRFSGSCNSSDSECNYAGKGNQRRLWPLPKFCQQCG